MTAAVVTRLPHPCGQWRPCFCATAGNRHCSYCGFPEHVHRRGDEQHRAEQERKAAVLHEGDILNRGAWS